MSLNAPRPPRPPRPGGARPGTRPAAPSRNSGLQSGAAAGGPSDFGDTRTVILSRKNMGMHQKRKGAEGQSAAPAQAATNAPAPAPVPQLPKATVVNNTVSCVKCSGSFPIMGDEYYGAVVECPDCSAEFVIPSKQEVLAQTPAAAPAPAPAAAPAPAPAAAPAPAPAAAPAPAPAAAPAPAPAAAPAPAPAAKKSAPKQGAKKKSPKSTAKNPAAAAPKSGGGKKRRPVKKVPPFVESELSNDEEVFVCETEAGGSGGAVLAAIFALLAGVAGIVPVLMKMEGPVAMAVPGGAGVLFAILAFVVAKGGGGSKALVVTEKRVFAKSGKWFAESNLDD